MKKIIFNGILCILTATLAVSCAPTVKVTTDYDRSANFAAYKSFSLYNFTSTLNVNELNAKRILNSVRSEMIKKGYTEDNYDPDLMINVVSHLKDKNLFLHPTMACTHLMVSGQVEMEIPQLEHPTTKMVQYWSM